MTQTDTGTLADSPVGSGAGKFSGSFDAMVPFGLGASFAAADAVVGAGACSIVVEAATPFASTGLSSVLASAGGAAGAEADEGTSVGPASVLAGSEAVGAAGAGAGAASDGSDGAAGAGVPSASVDWAHLVASADDRSRKLYWSLSGTCPSFIVAMRLRTLASLVS